MSWDNLWPALLGAGAGAGGALAFGDKGSGDELNDELLQLIRGQAGASGSLLAETGLVRKLVLAPIEATLLGMRPSQLPVFAPARETLESQFGVGRENILSNVPIRGGQLNEALVNLNVDRARALAGMDADLAQAMFQTGAQVGFGVPGVALGGMGAAAQGLAGLAAAQAQQEAGKGAGIGGLVGNLAMAAALKGRGR